MSHLRSTRLFTPLATAWVAFFVGCASSPGPVQSIRPSGHFDGGRFFNPGAGENKGFSDFLRWQFNRQKGHWDDWTDDVTQAVPPESETGESLRVTFVNHSTALIQVDGINILTDPIWSERASPVTWLGPKRRRLPGIRFEDLPSIHAVLISHNHYDHLDLPTVVRLKRAHDPLFLVPLGVRALLEENGVDRVLELDWWQQVDLNATTAVHFVPARHFSGRGLGDQNQTLWGGYLVQTNWGKIYFAGDTGHGPHFFEIRQRFGPIDLALIPIGAFRPEWFMSPVHLSPKKAVRAHQLLKAKTSVGIHHSTFPLADDGQHEPARKLRVALEEKGIARDRFWIPKNGESRVFGLKSPQP